MHKTDEKRRVVVTGLGAISSIGIGKDDFWKAALEGRSGISDITSLDTKDFKCHKGGEVKNFNPEEFIPKRKVKFLGRASQLAISASLLAFKDAGLTAKGLVPKSKTGVFIGTTMGEKPVEELAQTWVKSGLKDLDRRKIIQASANNLSANVALFLKTQGQNYLFPTACAAGITSTPSSRGSTRRRSG
jgi:3-oxoacyl-[acyl-carrier-protein] synthase II